MPCKARECGVTPYGRWISLKGAVAHFFLSSLLPFPSSCNNLFPEFPNRRSTLSFPPPFSPTACCLCLVLSHPLRAIPVLSLVARCVPSLPSPQLPAACRPCPVLPLCAASPPWSLSCCRALPAHHHPCPATGSPAGLAVTLCCITTSSSGSRISEPLLEPSN